MVSMPYFDLEIDINQGWVLTACSSLMSLLGCLIIYADALYSFFMPRMATKHKFQISTNGSFLVACLSLSSGSLLYTSLSKLLPHASESLGSHDYLSRHGKTLNLIIMTCYLSGISVFIALNAVIHYFTSESIIHCAHEGKSEEEHSHSHHNHGYFEGTAVEESDNQTASIGSDHANYSSVHEDGDDDDDDVARKTTSTISNDDENHNGETSPLLVSMKKPKVLAVDTNDKTVHTRIKYGDLQSFNALLLLKHPFSKKKSNLSLVAYSPKDKAEFTNLDERINQSSGPNSIVAVADDDAEEVHNLSDSASLRDLILVDENHLHEHEAHRNDHRHKNVATSVSKLFSIGIQTTLAISLHKFPEGFIYYATSKIDEELSFNIFLSLAIHNIAEGFSMALPLYLSMNSRLKAVLIAGVLGSFSQPLGALVAVFLLPKDANDIDEDQINLAFGCLMGITSGFLTIIGLQMLLSAIRFGGSNKFVLFWFIFGLSIINFTSVLTGTS